ncbi:hypothetical protein, partial [Paraprevotella clara]|uniref:hypothetical protein n=1 Tax=Paraprevotella clara TaxID=454154 RepID=UPI00307A1F78
KKNNHKKNKKTNPQKPPPHSHPPPPPPPRRAGIKQSVPFPGICYMQFKGRGYGQNEYKKLTA